MWNNLWLMAITFCRWLHHCITTVSVLSMPSLLQVLWECRLSSVSDYLSEDNKLFEFRFDRYIHTMSKLLQSLATLLRQGMQCLWSVWCVRCVSFDASMLWWACVGHRPTPHHWHYLMASYLWLTILVISTESITESMFTALPFITV